MNKFEIRRQRLKAIKDEQFNGVIAALAEKIDKNPSYVSRLLYPEGHPNKKNIADKMVDDIEKALNLPRGWLDGLVTDDKAVLALSDLKKDENLEYNFVKIEVFDIEASCGHGSIVDRETINVLRSIEFTAEFAFKLFGKRNVKYIKVITAKGDSMVPTLRSGANVFVDTEINFFDGDGVYVFVHDNELYIKRLQMTGDKLIVISDNPIYERWRVEKSLVDLFYIQGKVVVGQNIDYVYFD